MAFGVVPSAIRASVDGSAGQRGNAAQIHCRMPGVPVVISPEFSHASYAQHGG